MEIQSPIETEDSILIKRHHISASIESEHKYNLISAVDAYNETLLVTAPSIDKEHFVLEGDYFLMQIGVVWISHIDLASEDMSPIDIYRPNEHLRSVLCHPVHIGVQTGYSDLSANISMLLLPLNSSRVVEHEQMSIISSHDHMLRVHKVSIVDVFPTAAPWEEHVEVRGVDQLEPAHVSNT